jgi:single-stranded DNA-binding protein
MSGMDALGRDAEAKVSKTSGKPYLRLNVRVCDGDDAQWVQVNSFDPNAIEAIDRLVKGARVYVRLDKWTGQDGTERQGLSCMARFTRLPAIGRNKPQKQDGAAATPARVSQRSQRSHDDLNSEIPF